MEYGFVFSLAALFCLAWLISAVLAGHVAGGQTSADLSVQRWKGH